MVNINVKSQYYYFYCIFEQIITALVITRGFGLVRQSTLATASQHIQNTQNTLATASQHPSIMAVKFCIDSIPKKSYRINSS